MTELGLVNVPLLGVVVEAGASRYFLYLSVSFLIAPAVDGDGLGQAILHAFVCLGQVVRRRRSSKQILGFGGAEKGRLTA